jgi:hypothetical protein
MRDAQARIKEANRGIHFLNRRLSRIKRAKGRRAKQKALLAISELLDERYPGFDFAPQLDLPIRRLQDRLTQASENESNLMSINGAGKVIKAITAVNILLNQMETMPRRKSDDNVIPLVEETPPLAPHASAAASRRSVPTMRTSASARG